MTAAAVNHAAVKFGKLPARHDARTLMLARYLGVLPAIPAACDWGKAAHAPWGMMANDVVGDCTCAAAGHATQAWTANHGTEVTIPDAAILAAYSAITGYTPSDPNSDQGAVELDVLKFWRSTGIGGRKIGAFAALEPKNKGHIRAALDLFGGLYIGLALPLSAQGQKVWSVPCAGTHGKGAPGSWGGHAVAVVAYDAAGLTCITWGALQKMTWRFWETYTDESYAILSPDWVAPGKVAPSGLDLAALQADLAFVTG